VDVPTPRVQRVARRKLNSSSDIRPMNRGEDSATATGRGSYSMAAFPSGRSDPSFGLGSTYGEYRWKTPTYSLAGCSARILTETPPVKKAERQASWASFEQRNSFCLPNGDPFLATFHERFIPCMTIVGVGYPYLTH